MSHDDDVDPQTIGVGIGVFTTLVMAVMLAIAFWKANH